MHMIKLSAKNSLFEPDKSSDYSHKRLNHHHPFLKIHFDFLIHNNKDLDQLKKNGHDIDRFLLIKPVHSYTFQNILILNLCKFDVLIRTGCHIKSVPV